MIRNNNLRIEDLGRLREMLCRIIDDERFDEHDLSRHNEKWGIRYKENELPTIEEVERASDLLDESRRRFVWIQEQLYDCLAIARGDEYET